MRHPSPQITSQPTQAVINPPPGETYQNTPPPPSTSQIPNTQFLNAPAKREADTQVKSSSVPFVEAVKHEERSDCDGEEGDDLGESSKGEDDYVNEQRKRKDTTSTRLEKQGYSIELNNIRQKGIILSRDFYMNDSIAEL